MKSLSIFLSVLLLTSLLAVINSAGSGSIATYADEKPLEKIPVGSAGTANGAGHVGDVTAASGNNRFVAWYDFTPGNYDIFFRRSLDNGANWQPTVNLSNNPGSSTIPQIAVSGSNVYVIWAQQSADLSVADIYVRRSTDNGATWGAKVKVSTSGTNFLPSLQIAVSGSNVYITWYDYATGTPDVFLRRSTDSGATWKSIVNISNNAGASYVPDIAASGSNVYITWYDYTTGNADILLRRSTDSGATWKAVKNLSNNATDSYGPQIAVSGSNVYVTWSDFIAGNYEILLRRSADSGATLQPLVQISNNAGDSEQPQVTTVGSDVYIAWYDNTPGNTDILLRRSADNGSTWKAVKNLSSNAGGSYLGEIAG